MRVGLDIGTTNSAVAVIDDEAKAPVRLARYTSSAGATETFRSILYFRSGQRPVGGPRAIDGYLAAEGDGRLIQSMKSYLADRTFQATSIFGRTTSLVDLLATLLRELRAAAESDLGPLGTRAVVGRPVHFASEKGSEDEALAVERLRAALAAAGWDDVELEYEPVAAAHYYETQLDHDELVLIADFGGGTSDFSLVRVGPGQRHLGAGRILGNDGVGIAGDALDAHLMKKLVAPELGMGITYRALMGEKDLPVPVWIYSRLLRWHHFSFLKSKKNIDLLEGIASQTRDRAPIRALLHVIENDLGYHLYRAVERTKVALSSATEARFTFADDPVAIDVAVTRAQFEEWIAEDMATMASCVDRLLDRAGVDRKDVDQVFLTGGSSFVPAVRRIFEDRFGVSRIRAGGELISVATGLALR
ncbi:MAG: Hsp70 family protein [Labilithrix sp.]|nr:Hsp70 family protein [Labilithrix sp.]MCW5813181.1 Hsp70 family protein [Labilithrix sp.]